MSYDLSDVTFRPISTWPGVLTRSRRTSPFRSTWTSTTRLLQKEMRALDARNVVVEVAISEDGFRIDGGIRARAVAEHPGVVVSFDSRYGPLRYAVDTYDDWQDNVRAIALAMQALRAVDRYGVTKRGEQYTGWRQIESRSASSRGVDLIREHGSVRAALASTHPDRGGDPDDFIAVQAAKNDAAS